MEPTTKCVTVQLVNFFARLGKEIKISPKAHISVNNPGYKIEYFTDTVEICIGIGKDHTATLIMEREAWEALNAGAKPNVITTEEYKKKYVYKVRKK
jgi:hypothetical protein